MNTLVRNVFQPGKYNNYLIGGNICNAFALGEVGSKDDFFLIGAEPPDESSYPLLTGNILDSEGNVLFRLVRNVLVLNPGHCSKIVGDRLGYEIHDGSGQVIFSVRTKFERLPGPDPSMQQRLNQIDSSLAASLTSLQNEEFFVTTITAKFYNKNRALVFTATSGEDEKIEMSVKSAFGFSGGFGFVQSMDKQELALAAIALQSHGTIHEVISGEVKGETIAIDGKALLNAQISDCTVLVQRGEFVMLGNSNFRNCRFKFEGPAANIQQIVLSLKNAPTP